MFPVLKAAEPAVRMAIWREKHGQPFASFPKRVAHPQDKAITKGAVGRLQKRKCMHPFMNTSVSHEDASINGCVRLFMEAHLICESDVENALLEDSGEELVPVQCLGFRV